MIKLLQLSPVFPAPTELFPSALGQSFQESKGGELSTFATWILFLVCCIALSEAPKVILRRNIGYNGLYLSTAHAHNCKTQSGQVLILSFVKWFLPYFAVFVSADHKSNQS